MSSIKEQLREMAEEIEEDVVEAMAPSSNPECELCGATKFQIDRIDSESKFEMYNVSCTDSQCDGDLLFCRWFVMVDGGVRIVNEEFSGVRCTGDQCDPASAPLQDVVAHNDPSKKHEFVLPIKGILTTMVHEHHTSYEPEETITVCAQCHTDIHCDDDFRPDLRPDMSRQEWEEKHD